jgi:adenylate cyclase
VGLPDEESDDDGGDWYARGMALHRKGRYCEAIAAFRRSIALRRREDAATYNVACGYARLGEKDRAFEWLERAQKEGFALSTYLRRDEDLDSLRDDPRFATVLRAVASHDGG